MSMLARWEWRIFSAPLGELINPFSSLTPFREDDSREVYYLLDEPDLNLKLRYGVLDMKRRLHKNEAGYEQWYPVFKASPPLNDTQIAELDALLPENILLDSSNIEATLFNNPHVSVVNVHKNRKRYLVGDVEAEFTQIAMKQGLWSTLALEHLDWKLIQTVRQTYDLLDFENESYPQALKRLQNME